MRYCLKSARYLAHEMLAGFLCPGDRVIDATMGNGRDTLFLCKAVGPAGHVFAFDIQSRAIEVTRSLLQEEGILDRADLILCGHQHMDEYITEKVHAVVFNLGWLPGGNHDITTRWETTREAVLKALDLLLPQGMLVLCVYPGHSEGENERQELLRFFASLPNRHYNVLHQRFLNASTGSPECFVVQNIRE